MEGRNRSGSHSGGVVKNGSSSGCLIIKKKPHGVSGVGSSKGSKLFESKKEKKRPRLNATNSVFSDEEILDFDRRRGVSGMNQVSGGSLVYEDDDFEDMGFGRNGLMREVGRPRRELDVYDFDEYDDLSDVEMMRMGNYHDRGMRGGERSYLSPMPGLKNGSGVEFESGSSKGDIIYKRRNSFHGGSSSERFRMGDVYSGKRRFEMRSEFPVSMGKDKLGGSDEAIRLQGKNGVLKVRVKHKEEISEHLSKNYVQLKGNSVPPRSQDLTSKNVVVRPSPYAEKNLPRKPIAADRLEKNNQRKRKPVAAESSEESDEEAEDSDSPPKSQTDDMQGRRSIKRGRSGGSTQSPQTAQPVKAKEGKVKRGSGTEKQLLREKIRSMLVSAGWTIDYRPRRGRDYFDAVYVNPTGTAYWSIIKAYDALQKQLEEEGNNIKASEDCSSFAPISEDVLSKLTRQTRKKIEKELKRKKREEAGSKRKKEFTSGSFEEDESDTDSGRGCKHDDKLSSFMKRSGKAMKGASKESCRDGSYSNSKMQERNENSSSTSNSRFIHARKSKIGRCTLLVRNSKKGLDSESDGFVPYTGKRNLLSWLIDSGTVKLSEKVHYMNRRCTRVMLEGWITREGIHCGCCSKILTVSKFEIHAASKLRQSYQNIYLSSGASLMQCQVDAWNKQEESHRNGFNKIDVNGDDPNDDTCAICGDGGNLICCDSCPSTFHQKCLGIKMLPPGDWHCPHCSCRFCGLADMNVNEGNDRRVDTVLTCSFCEGKFHCSCVEEMDDTPINSYSPLFCGKSCQELSEQLQNLLGIKHELEDGLCWSLIHRTDLESDTSIRSYPQRVEWNSKLAVAQNVMDECFLPIIDRRSGINMIHSVLYNNGSNITRLNYSGFYTAILEKGDEIIAAASIRIRSTEFAEMPFIGTRHIYRRQGMCRRLFAAIEWALRSLKVEKLIIPAISELMDTWTTVFGFSTLQESDKHDMKIGNMLVFPGTDMLLKNLLDQESVKRGLAGVDSFQNGSNTSILPDSRKKSDLQSSPGLSSAAADSQNEEIKDKSVTDFGSQHIVCTDEKSLCSASAECCEEVKPLMPAENEEIKDKSGTDFGLQDIGCADEKFLYSASSDRCDKVQPSLPTVFHHDSNDNTPLHTASAPVLNNINPVSNEGDPGATSSEMQLDSKFNECSSQVKDHISADASIATCETESLLDDSAAGQYVEVSVDCKLTQRTNVTVAESVLTSADVSVAAASDDGVLNGFARKEDEIQRDGIVISNDESTAHGKDHSQSEAPNVVLEKPTMEPTAEDDFHNLPEVEVDDPNIVPSAADRKDDHLLEASHVDVEMEKPMMEPTAEGDFLHPSKVEVDDANIVSIAADRKDDHLSKAPHVDVEIEKPINNPSAEDKRCHSPDVEVDNADIVPGDVCSGSQFLHYSDNTDLDMARVPKITEEREALHVDDRAGKSPQNPSHNIFAIEKPQPDSYGRITEQLSLEDDMKHVQVANVQPSSNSTFEISSCNVDSSIQSSEDPPSVANDGGIEVTDLLHVSEIHDQDTK